MDEQYVSITEIGVWFVGVVLMMIGLHFVFIYWGTDFWWGKGNSAEIRQVVIEKETKVLWCGPFGQGGYALLRVPSDSTEVASFRDEVLSLALNREVCSYWLTFYSFESRTPVFELDLSRDKVVARVAGKALENLAPAELNNLPAVLRTQILPSMAPLRVGPGLETRCLLLFPAHDRDELQQLILPGPGGKGQVKLTRAMRPANALAGFLAEPKQSFFESAHVKKSGKTK